MEELLGATELEAIEELLFAELEAIAGLDALLELELEAIAELDATAGTLELLAPAQLACSFC